jgi:hypothetical protein
MSQQTSEQRWEQQVLAMDGDVFIALVGADEQALTSSLPTTLSWSASTTGGRPTSGPVGRGGVLASCCQAVRHTSGGARGSPGSCLPSQKVGPSSA